MAGTAIRLPGLLSEIEEVAGRKAAVDIATTHGGRRRKFPSPGPMEANPPVYAKNWLVLIVGFQTALQIAKELFPAGGCDMDIPSARTELRRQYVLDNAATLSISEMSEVLDVGERAIRRTKERLREEGLLA